MIIWSDRNRIFRVLVRRNGVKTITKNTEAIPNMKPHASQKEVLPFMGVVNYYPDIQPRRIHTLALLTKIMSNKNDFYMDSN